MFILGVDPDYGNETTEKKKKSYRESNLVQMNNLILLFYNIKEKIFCKCTYVVRVSFILYICVCVYIRTHTHTHTSVANITKSGKTHGNSVHTPGPLAKKARTWRLVLFPKVLTK